jgi:Pretoxin HINT domain
MCLPIFGGCGIWLRHSYWSRSPLPPFGWADAPSLRYGLSPKDLSESCHGPSVFLFVAAFRNVPPQTPAGLKDSSTMQLTATNQRTPYRALWRLLTLIVGVIAFIGSTTGTASALTAITARSSSGHSVVVGPETRVGVTNHFSGTSSARLATIQPACVGENGPGYDRITLASCVATKPGTAAAKAGRSCFKSFGGETRVLMGDGTTRPISEIAVGDLVLAQDPETGEVSARRVTDTWVHDDDLVRLEIGGDVVRTTEDHPFWNATDSEWQRADELSLGDSVFTADGRRVKVGVLLGSAGRGSAYNLTVEGLHTYHVLFGTDAVLVHNADCFDFVGEAADYADDELASMARRHIAGAANKRPSEAAILDAMQTGTATRIRGSATVPGAVQFVKGKVTVIINEGMPWQSTAFFPGAG